MIANADFHIHSSFSGGTSNEMNIKRIAEGSRRKGLQILGTGDCLHPLWENEIKHYEKEGEILVDGIHFLLTTEIEDEHRVHHLIVFPDFYAVTAFREKIRSFSANILDEGRPSVKLSGAELLDYAIELDALLGPAHAFTPWTSLYAYFNSVIKYYGKRPSFIELGLSADSNYADRISELNSIPFLTNSDAHSYMPHRLGREFNRLNIEGFSYEQIKKSILHNNIVLNAGFPPEKGKYNRTACSTCYRQYEKQFADQLHWQCYCGGVIKKGVSDRVDELSNYKIPIHPPFRPSYMHLIPLAEIISTAINVPSQATIARRRWQELTELGSEIEVLLDVDMTQIRRTTPEAISNAIYAFRNGDITIIPGGGGKYGEVVIN